MAAEHQIQNLKTRLNEIQSRQREVKTAPVSSPEAARKKKEQIRVSEGDPVPGLPGILYPGEGEQGEYEPYPGDHSGQTE